METKIQTKEKNLQDIKEALGNPTPGQNSMGASESYYNPYYMIGKCFTEEELNALTKGELNNLIKLAGFAGDVFY